MNPPGATSTLYVFLVCSANSKDVSGSPYFTNAIAVATDGRAESPFLLREPLGERRVPSREIFRCPSIN